MKKPLKILTASAGSGKTHRLTGDFINLLFSGNNKYREILAVTFTNKATAEMKSRILSVLRSLANNEENPDTQFFKNQLLAEFPEKNEEEIRQQAKFIYRQILHDYSRLSISTIDKFVLKIIRSLSSELHIDAGFQIELNTYKVTQELSQKLKESLNEQPELLDWYIQIAKRKIRNQESWDFTRALNQLANEIYSEDFQIFEMAFHEMEDPQILEKLIKDAETHLEECQQNIATKYDCLHKLFLEFDGKISDFSRHNSNPLRLLKQPFQKKLLIDKAKPRENQISKIILRKETSHYFKKSDALLEDNIQFFEASQPLIADLEKIYHELFPEMMTISAVLENLYYLKLVIELSRLLANYRSEHGVLLSSDATHLLNGIAKDHQDNPSFIWEKVGNRFNHYLFDEFQDTSRKQWENFLPLLKNSLSQSRGVRTEHLIVGDAKQSIYRWRDGDWRLLLENAGKDLGEIFIEKDSLSDNYRSDSNIIKFNNMIFKKGPIWLQEKMNDQIKNEAGEEFFEQWKYASIFSEIYDPHSTIQQIPEGRDNTGGIIEIKEFEVENNKHRYSQAKQELLQHTADSLYKWIVEEKKYTAGQIGILVKTNQRAKEIISFVLEDLKKRNHSQAFQIISGDAFLLKENIAIQLLIDLLYLINSPEKNQTLYIAKCILKYKLLQTNQEDKSNNLSEKDWLNAKELNIRSINEYFPERFSAEFDALKNYPLNELIEGLIDIFQIGTQAEHLSYLLHFRSSIAQFNQQGAKDISSFLEWWEEEQEKLSLPASEGTEVIEVLTIHKSKGLAFDVVMLPILDWSFGDSRPNNNKWFETEGTKFDLLKKIPVSYKKDLNETLFKHQYWEEELFNYIDSLNELYVAMTRAKNHLFINLIGSSTKTELNNYIASDLIKETLTVYQHIHNEEYNLNPDLSPERTKKTKDINPNRWTFTSYPIAHHLNVHIDKEEKDRMQRLSNLKSKRLGAVAHELLEKISTLEEIDYELNKMLAEGKYAIHEQEEIRELVSGALKHKDLQNLLLGDYEHLNEQTIIDAQGNSHRPDKIMIKNKEAIIIDFKFTTSQQQAHVKQVQHYKDLLFQMGFSAVRAYLFYGNPINELKEI